MWIRDVDLPEALIDAHRIAQLVIFVGAGASRAAPSSLADFRTLTADIAAESGGSVTDEQLDQPDVLLGDLQDERRVDVHVRVAARIGDPSSAMNELHDSIVALAAAAPPARIVTTNYDLHLSAAAAARGLSLTEYMAPALPMGDDFTGLVYLHGCLRQDPRHLVVTDVDFGRAYLRDAWAARFLERMFATYTVLFVGYSHSDVAMSYLGRSLRSDSARFVLTAEPEARTWRRLGIHPIGYPLAGHSHGALVGAIAGWASWASMGLLDHRQRVSQLVAGAPSHVPDEASYMETVIAGGDTVGFFTEYTRGAEWLSWASAQSEFKRLFDPRAEATPCTWPLAYWFVHHYVMDETLTESALSVVQDAGGRVAETLWHALGQSLHARNEPRPDWLGPWVVVLAQHAPENARDWLEYALTASRWPEDRDSALLLFDCLTEPRAELRPWFGPGPHFDVRLRGDDYWLREAWEKLFTPNIADAASDVLVIADRHLRHAYRLLSVPGAARPGWDPLSFTRSAIVPHGQDAVGESIGVLIDAARDCLEALLDGGGPLGPACLDSWASSDVPLLRRLAVHWWTHRNDVDANAKLSWMRETGWLFDHQLRHEVFRLVAKAIPDATEEVADALVSDALAGPEDADEHGAYETYNALTWIARHAPGLDSAHQALEQVKAEHPGFEERPHPDLVAWSEVGAVGRQPPMTAAELHELILQDVGAAITDLRKYEDKASPFEGPTWHDAAEVLAETVSASPTDGFAVLDATGADHLDITRAVIRGWASATVDDNMAELIANRLAAVDLSRVADDVTRMLLAGSTTDTTTTKWHTIPAARRLATAVWPALPDGSPQPEVDGWLSRATNHSAGRLAEFWVHAVAADWRAAGDTWQGLPLALQDQLEVLLCGDDERAALAEVIYASQLHFFFSADRAWCDQWVLPLLDWADPECARRTWDGFLTRGRWNDHLLAAGLLDHYLGTAHNLGVFTDELRRQYCQHLANVALHSEVDPVESGWVRTFTASVDTALRVEWMNQVAWLLARLPVEAVEHQWARWMRRYWNDRLASVPVQLTEDEASAMSAWVVDLGHSITEGVALAVQRPARLAEHSTVLHDLTADRVARAPAAIAELVGHLLRGAERPFYGCHSLKNVVRALRAQPTPVNVRAVVEEALRLGCADAPDW